jgi:hypothetical protein
VNPSVLNAHLTTFYMGNLFSKITVLFFLAFFISVSSSFAQEQRLVHRYFVQSSYYKDTSLKNIAKSDNQVKSLIDSAEKNRKRVFPKLLLSAVLYGISLSQLPKEYVYYNDVPAFDYKSMERRASFTFLLSGIAFFSILNPVIKKDYYISKAYNLAKLNNPYIPLIQKTYLKKLSLEKFEKAYLKYNILRSGGKRTEFERRVALIDSNSIKIARIRDELPFLTSTFKSSLNYKVIDSNSNNVVIRCCSEFPLDYYFKNNILIEFKIEKLILIAAYDKYLNIVDSLKKQQLHRQNIIKLKR